MGISRERRGEVLAAAVGVLGEDGAGSLAVRDGDVSMLPTLRAGQRLWVEFVPAEPRVGDVLLFRQQDYLVVHRLLGRARDESGRPSLRTRGDGWNGLDPHVAPDAVVGRVVACRDGGGWWDLDRPLARSYGRALAWHALAWAAAGSAAGIVDGWVFRRPKAGPLRRTVAAIDRGLLHLVHFLLFRWVHARRTAPEGPQAAAILHD